VSALVFSSIAFMDIIEHPRFVSSHVCDGMVAVLPAVGLMVLDKFSTLSRSSRLLVLCLKYLACRSPVGDSLAGTNT